MYTGFLISLALVHQSLGHEHVSLALAQISENTFERGRFLSIMRELGRPTLFTNICISSHL